MNSKRPLEMTIDLNVLEHLGMNLYSNMPAVLSEIVANAWDADAETVYVELNSGIGEISIQDNGDGMNRDEVINHFLTVGFKRRDQLGELTTKERRPMGRKGIGKLSAFSVAQIVDVFTMREGEKTAFRMDREKIRESISEDKSASYAPEELNDWPDDFEKGTRIVLTGLSKQISGMTVSGLKRRIARRFSIIGPKFDFEIQVNGDSITPADRGYYYALEYLWTYGDQSEIVGLCSNLQRSSQNRTAEISIAVAEAGITLTGWLGTVKSPRQLKDEEGDNLNHIAVFMRGKLALEDILGDFGQKEIYASYVIGEIYCDSLDEDDSDDIATSSRQAIKQDDPRYAALRNVVLSELRHIASQWSVWRIEDGTKFARSVPEVSDWLDSLQGDTHKKAQRWVGRMNVFRTNTEFDKKEMLKASILAFESFRRKEQLSRLDDIADSGLDAVLTIFRDIDDLEVSYYGQIVRLRLAVLRSLQDKLEEDQKEAVIRDHVFKSLWLLDPSWERAKGTEHVEKQLNKFLKQNTDGLNAQQKKARIDIGYRTESGKHVIIECKRASVAVPLDDMTKQIRKYRDGARKLLDKTEYKEWPLVIICLVGKPPPEWNDVTGQEGVHKALENVNARILFYDQLLSNAEKTYADYIKQHAKVDKLWNIFQAIDDFAPDDNG